MLKYIKGDLIELAKQGKFDVISHGCNCFCLMGNGIAKQIKQEFPNAYELDCNTVKGDKTKLGKINYVFDYKSKTWIVNAYTQFNIANKNNPVAVDYEAVRSCMKEIKFEFEGEKRKFGFPMIGSGLAGGDWEIIEKIIEEEMYDEDVTIVVYDKE